MNVWKVGKKIKYSSLDKMNKELEKELNILLDNNNSLPNFEERKKILTDLLWFTCSDLDNYQFFKKMNNNRTYFYLSLDETWWEWKVINLDDFSNEQKRLAVSNWWYDMKSFSKQYLNDDDYNHMLCEAIYENEFESWFINLTSDLLSKWIKINFTLSDNQKDIIKWVATDIINTWLDNSNEVVKEEVIDKLDFNRLIDLVKDTLIQDVKDNWIDVEWSIIDFDGEITDLDDIIEEVWGYLESCKVFLPVFWYTK